MIGFSVGRLSIEIFFTCSNNIWKLYCTSNIIKIHTLAQLCSNILNMFTKLAFAPCTFGCFMMELFCGAFLWEYLLSHNICAVPIKHYGRWFGILFIIYIWNFIIYIPTTCSSFPCSSSILSLSPFEKKISVPFFLPNIFIKHQKPHANYTISVGIIRLYTPQPSSQCKM